MTKHILLSLSILSLALLQACGGGDSNDGNADTAALNTTPAAAQAQAPAAADIGTVSAKFVPNDNTRYMLFAIGSQSMGSGVPSEQADSGAMVRLGSSSLSGAQQTADIAGDTHFALGRWLKGTVTKGDDTRTLDGGNQSSHHCMPTTA